MATLNENQDAASRLAYLAEGNAKQARKRAAVDVILRDGAGRILVVDPVYKPDWDLPGGMVEKNEPPRQTAIRELREELDLTLEPGQLLYIEWVPPHGPWDDMIELIFDGGVLSDPSALRLADGELRAAEFVEPNEAAARLRPYVWARAKAALAVLEGAPLCYREPSSLHSP